MRSVTTRSPESRVVSVCSGNPGLAPVGIAVGARAPLGPAALAGVPARPAAVAARPAVAAAVAPAAAHRRVAGADRLQLLLGLAGDVRVLGEPQADAPALLVHLHDADVDLVALVEHLLDRRRPLAGRDVGDVQEPVRALGQLDEGAERGGLDHLRAREVVADLHFLRHAADALDERVALGAGLRVDAHRAVVLDVDLRLVLLRQAADRLAALADEQADLVRVDLDGRDARRVLGQLGPRRVDG